MIKRYDPLAQMKNGYLFPEIHKRKREFLEKHPNAELISLGVGDTTQPLPKTIADALADYGKGMKTTDGYTGYGSEQGDPELRTLISEKLYHGLVNPNDIYLSDGAKCDIGRLQLLFGPETRVAVQDPAYPVYVDTTLITDKLAPISYIPCTPENNFFPQNTALPAADLFFICSPNNPTGTTLNHSQLKNLVNHAKKHRSIIIYDTAYACFIQDPSIPRSIYEIPGAEEVAIEVNSFSKMAGFTGLRLGWTILPKELKYDDHTPISTDWSRIVSTFFNGASSIVQAGGRAALSDEGLREIRRIIGSYADNANLLRNFFLDAGFPTYGGDHSPYVWVDFRPKTSWEMFDRILQESHIISIPGAGFGDAGDGFVRFSAFADRDNILEAIKRMKRVLEPIHS